MRIYFGFILLLFIMPGCDSDEIAIKDFVEFTIDGEKVELAEVQFFGNENCGKIFVNGSITRDTGPRFRFEIDLTINGHIDHVTLYDYDDHRTYKTADFISSKSFSIDNFTFSPPDRSLSFDFEGTLYDIRNSAATKHIAGKVLIKDLLDAPCSWDYWEVEAEINQQPFTAVEIAGKSNSEMTEWLALSDDGMKISLITENELKDMPVGTYLFTREDFLNRVIIQNYTGPTVATISRFLTPENWESYDYEGELVIEQQIANEVPKTIGRFSVRASKNDEIIYDVTNGRFSIEN
jgi:hypothetical protein